MTTESGISYIQISPGMNERNNDEAMIVNIYQCLNHEYRVKRNME